MVVFYTVKAVCALALATKNACTVTSGKLKEERDQPKEPGKSRLSESVPRSRHHNQLIRRKKSSRYKGEHQTSIAYLDLFSTGRRGEEL
jgi:hypothetical protein